MLLGEVNQVEGTERIEEGEKKIKQCIILKLSNSHFSLPEKKKNSSSFSSNIFPEIFDIKLYSTKSATYNVGPWVAS